MTATKTPTIRVTGWDASARRVRYTERGYGANDAHPFDLAAMSYDVDLDSLDACRSVPQAVKTVVRMLAGDRGIRTNRSTMSSPEYTIRITTGDDQTRVFRSLGVSVMHGDREVGTIPTRLIFGAGDESGRLNRGREEELCVEKAVEWLRDCGLRIERADMGIWDDRNVTVTTLADSTV